MSGGDSGRVAAVEAAIRGLGVEWDIDPTLERIETLMDLLGHPQRNYPVIHISGTNGKSSTARMIEALLLRRNLRVGRYTSPEVREMRDRISVDGEALSPERFVAAYDDVAPFAAMVNKISFFEMLTAMAFAAFADAPVDVAVVEVGLGGTWDATNVTDGEVAVVTPISLDHTSLLGDDVETIAGEKAGIIKEGAHAVLAQQPLPAAEVLMERAAERQATVAREGLEFGVRHREVAVGGQMITIQGLKGTYEDVFLPLYGEYQAGNAACALAAVEIFAGDEPLDPGLVRDAFAGTESPGRLEVVRRSPTIIVDAAHNPGGMAATVAAVQESFGFTRLIGVVAVMADKDVDGVLEQLEPILSGVIVTRNSSPRSMPAEELAELAEGIFDEVHVAGRLDDAIADAVAMAEEEGDISGIGVLITGSVVTAADARVLLGAEK